ncbi:MAG: hypothetical protein QOJ60_122 [Actinomycetota bacterium]|jgi:hypothetical protein|nr:hypothetical protein [Actinomycetota bacterium]
MTREQLVSAETVKMNDARRMAAVRGSQSGTTHKGTTPADGQSDRKPSA